MTGIGSPGNETENHFKAIGKSEGPEAEAAARAAAGARKRPRCITNLRSKRRKPHMTANTETLQWRDPATLIDGTPIPTPFTVAIFDSASPTPTVAIGTVAGGVQEFTTPVLAPGVHTFTAVVTDTAGISSAPSNVFSVTIEPEVDISPPMAITNLSGTLNS